MADKYIHLKDVIQIFETHPDLQGWHTYEEVVRVLRERLPKTPTYVLYALCKRCRISRYFDSVKLNRKWYISLQDYKETYDYSIYTPKR